MVAAERRVEFGQLLMGVIIGGTDDDAVRAHAIGQGAAFLEKLGVGHHPHLQAAFVQALQFFAGQLRDFVGGTDRNRGLDDQGAICIHQIDDLPGDAQHVGEVGRTIFIRWGTDGDEDQFGMGNRVTGLGTEQ
ncbi:hypothetical protein D3C79_651180 [compost metagenome]